MTYEPPDKVRQLLAGGTINERPWPWTGDRVRALLLETGQWLPATVTSVYARHPRHLVWVSFDMYPGYPPTMRKPDQVMREMRCL